MALDGIYLSQIRKEINRALESAKVDKIQQPEKDEIVIVFRMRSGPQRLLLSASANTPRIHLTQQSKENPLSPPMFCMLLRKHLTGAKFAGARQPVSERILFLDFDGYDEFGDEARRTLAIEVMGRHSNIILLDGNGKIMDAVKHIDETMSKIRQVLPGLPYELPPKQDKISLLGPQTAEQAVQAAVEKILAHRSDRVSKALLDSIMGVSPIVCREIAYLACRDTEIRLEAMRTEEKDRLAFFLRRTADDVRSGRAKPVMALDVKTSKPLDFAFMEITQYGTGALTKECGSFSGLLDSFYSERDRIEHFNQRAQDIFRLLTTLTERLARKLDSQREELARSEDRQHLRVCGDLIMANLFRLKKGESICRLENYYEEGAPLAEIALDPMLTPTQNAQKYYKEYRKASVAEKYLQEQIASALQEMRYLDSVFDELTRASGESGLLEIREELASGGYLKNRGPAKKKMPREGQPLKFRSSDGFTILVGRNNRQNDLLTLKTAQKTDVWLHTKNIPGAHVIVSCAGRPVPERTLTQAAELAAFHSKASDSRQVPVDYTHVRYVKKPAGAKPGMVIYERYKTAFVNPDPELAEKLSLR